jgi:hypothetical protein
LNRSNNYNNNNNRNTLKIRNFSLKNKIKKIRTIKSSGKLNDNNNNNNERMNERKKEEKPSCCALPI